VTGVANRAPGPRRIRPWRRVAEWAQAGLVLGLPFLRIRGESALRFDVPRLELHAFGATIWMDEFFVVLAGSLFLLFAFLLLTVLFGRLWCGWACPQTALVDLTRFLGSARKKGGWRVPAAYGAVALASLLVAANLIWYFVTPAEFFRRMATSSLGPAIGGTWLVAAAVVFADLAFWRQGFCATTCPYAKFQGALLDRDSMVIAYDSRREEDCIDCKACVRVCPVGIDIRHGLQAACTSCGECIDACAPIMAKLGRRPKLVGYFFGDPAAGDEPTRHGNAAAHQSSSGAGSASGRTPDQGARMSRRLLRPGVLALATLTAASLALTVAVAVDRSPLDMTVTASSDYAARRASSGEAYLAFGLAFENRGREPLDLALALRSPGIDVNLRPDHVVLQPGEHKAIRLVAVARGLAGRRAVSAEFSAVAAAPGAARAVRTVTLSAPERP
jgi:cytochrome c oxidase accessory protein FixG